MLFGDQWHLAGSGEFSCASPNQRLEAEKKKPTKTKTHNFFWGVPGYVTLCFLMGGINSLRFDEVDIYILLLPYRFIVVRWLRKSTDSKTQDVQKNGTRLNMK